MKRNRLFILGIVTVLVALLSLTLVSGTFAKYTSSAISAVDSARVAKWSIKVGTTEIANETPQEITFDLFNTVKDTAGADEDDVKVGSGETIIAPGTSGSFDLSLQNLSEVTAEIALTVVETNDSDIPLVFTVDGAGSYETIQAALDAAFGLDATNHKAVFAMEQASATTKTIGWKWLFETDPLTDTADTALGIAAQTTPQTYSVQLTVIATQKD